MGSQHQTLETSKERKQKILLYILDLGPATREEISQYLGIARVELAPLIFELNVKKGLVYIKDEKDHLNNEEDKRLWLTQKGRETAALLLSKNPKLKTGKRHIHGIVGKIDLSKPFGGTKAIVYGAITAKRMDPRKIAGVANLHINLVTQTLDELVKLEVVNLETAYGTKQYSRVQKYERALLGKIDEEEEEEERTLTIGTSLDDDERILRKSNIRPTSQSGIVYCYMDENEDKSANTLSRETGINSTNPTTVMSSLVKKGLVEKIYGEDPVSGRHTSLFHKLPMTLPPTKEPPKKVEEPEAPTPPPLKIPELKKVNGKSNIEKFLDSLSDAELFDVVLEAMARIDSRQRELQSFHDNIMKSAQQAENQQQSIEH